MNSMNPEDISRIVDAVVRRVEAGLGAPRECRGMQQGSTEKVMIDSGADRVSITNTPDMNCADLASYIDHTLLKANATETEIEKLCREALQYKFASVCVNTSYVDACARLLAGSQVKVCCVVGFPLGAMSADAKAFETRDAVRRGAQEIDMVINVGKLQSYNFAYVYDDIRAVVRAASGRIVKVIIETALLNEDQKIAACVLAKAADADFVKTSTGFSTAGATEQDIALMRRVVGADMGIKAAGGIRDCPTAIKMVTSGATRVGASASVGIVKGGDTGKKGY